MAIDPRQFWDDKILRWEADRYGPGSADASPLERLARRASRSLRARQALARELIAPHVQGKRVVELGCGSGLLAEPLLEAGAAGYLGIDIAPSAVAAARERTAHGPHAARIAFEVGDVGSLPAMSAEIVFSLGLLDWLTLPQIEAVFAAGGSADYLHAISEKRRSPAQWLHRLYVHLAYGRRTGAYVPRYYSVAEIEGLALRRSARPMRVFRNPALSFGAFLTSLPLPAQ